jgi:N-acetylgalactosamine-6-sulfatase
MNYVPFRPFLLTFQTKTTMKLSFVLLVVLLSGGSIFAAARQPNIIFILADDYGWGDPHCYGHPYSKTPNIDRLAKEGTRFTQFYSTGVTCCPARAGLMTGKLPATFAKYPADFGYGDRVTITELLKKQGYTTGHVGKWHMGTVTEPGTYGIDVIGWEDTRVRQRNKAEEGKDTLIYDQAIEFIVKHKEEPFYLNVWSHITHHTINPMQRFVVEFAELKVDESKFSDYQREKFATVKEYGGDVSDAMRRFLGEAYSMDQDIGRLLAKLDELGLSENTLVVFSSDQGPSAPKDVMPTASKIANAKARGKAIDLEKSQLGLNLLGYAGPNTRGGKHTDYEGGVRVPFIVRWPGHTPAGRVDEHSVISGADWLPTMCAIAGVPIRAADFDGEDASKAIFGGVYERVKPMYWRVNQDNSDPAIRWQNWKLRSPQRSRRPIELYDLVADPGERHNLASEKPDVVQELSTKLNAWTATLPTMYQHGETIEN